MPRDLFGDISDPSVRVGTRSRYTVPVSFAIHSVVVAALLAVPILAPAVLPSLRRSSIVYAEVAPPPVPPPPPPPPPVRPSVEPPPPAVNPSAAPVTAPDSIRPETGREVDFPVPRTADIGVVGVAGVLETEVTAPPPTPPPAPIRVGGTVRPPSKIRDVAPVYPPLALTSRVEGTVIIDAVIDEQGRVQSTRVLRSVPLLEQAALAAVREWIYTPTLLNGVPVPVVMTVTVRFRLD